MAKYNYATRQRKKAMKFIYLLHYIGVLSKEEMERLTGKSKNEAG
jgi:hypothetical protein